MTLVRVSTRTRRHDRLTVEKLAVDCLDVRELRRAGAFTDNWVMFPWAAFRWASVKKMSTARYGIRIQLRNHAVPQQIRLSWTRCNFGSYRPWLHCPHCERRVARLFKGLGGYFCRACLSSPIYESQRRSTKARAYLRAHRLRQRLDGSRPVLDPMPERPYRMKRVTYDRLCSRIERVEEALKGSRIISRAPIWIAPLAY